MGIAINIKDGVTPALKRRIRNVTQVNQFIGRTVTNQVRSHLFKFNAAHPNKLGGKRTNFYAQSARSTHFDLMPNGVIISVSHLGIRQRYYGGVIRPKNAQYLTIPARAEAHGKTAREFNDLRVGFGRRGGQIVPVSLYQALSQKVAFRGGRVSRGRLQGGLVMFWLVKEVNQVGDKTVIPTQEQVMDVAKAAAVAKIKEGD